MDSTSPRVIRNTLNQWRITAKKGLGQHFLADTEVLQTIISTADITPGDIIIEIGPGLGLLTSELAKKAGKVIAIELDNKLVNILRRTMIHRDNIQVVHADILKIDPYQEIRPRSSYKIVANLPYNIASATIQHILECPVKPTLMVVMVQKEVADAIAAPPGRMRLLSVIIQVNARVEVITKVPPKSFYPQPKVNSAIIRLVPHTLPVVEAADVKAFLDFVASGFSQPRKQLGNSLSQGLHLPNVQITDLLTVANIDRHRRAETLSINEWVMLWRCFCSMEICPQ
ncbi:16S rRNA (adenine(1518)-N(6)/adenine(1519)-N(6))-dimethyltransferase RsmA [Chloroflexota bacterium]